MSFYISSDLFACSIDRYIILTEYLRVNCISEKLLRSPPCCVFFIYYFILMFI
jgi:hypothetical protein